MSSARASAAEVGIFAAGPDTPTLWPLRRRISSVVPTLVPRRVIIAPARRFGRERKLEPGSAGSARDSSAARRGDDTRDGARLGMAWTNALTKKKSQSAKTSDVLETLLV